ncbi:MAG: 50S ribosomal protein L4 [Chlamydiota bacterium]
MTTLKKYNLAGKETGSVKCDDQWLGVQANSQMVKDYIVALRANARQWSANTKGRSEVSHSTKKPHRQKGLGRARQGSLVAPQFRGGGIVFGPKPKFDQHVRINAKERRKAIRSLVAEMIKDNRVIVLEDSAMEDPKTKHVAAFIQKAEIQGKRILFLGEGSYVTVPAEEGDTKVSVSSDKHDNLIKSLRNIPKVGFKLAKNISGYDVMVAHDLVVTEAALEEIMDWLK